MEICIKKKRKRVLEGEYELWVSFNKRKNYQKVTPELIGHIHEWIGNYPKVVKLTISNDTLLFPDHKQPGKKVGVSKLLLQISIRELHNDLVSENSIYQSKEAIYESTGKPLTSDTDLHALMPNNVRKITDRYKQMCGCEICVIIFSM